MKILCDEAEENNLDTPPRDGLRGGSNAACASSTHGVVLCALDGVLEDVLGPAGDGAGRRLRDERARARFSRAKHHEDALVVKEAALAMTRRLERLRSNCLAYRVILRIRMNCARTLEEALQMRQEETWTLEAPR